jgi:hypothetical protein
MAFVDTYLCLKKDLDFWYLLHSYLSDHATRTLSSLIKNNANKISTVLEK